ncbi:ATP-binding protein [Serratia proteamaculans]|uniref:ATP-binding protein n=1 Tax=Serratia proteamaculans TaxID=28151 RepID=UPI0039B07745
MNKIIHQRIASIEKLQDPSHVRPAILGLSRIILQHACISLGEWIANLLKENPNKLTRCPNFEPNEFISPADGSLINLLSQLFVVAENLGWKSAGKNYWLQITLEKEVKEIVGTTKANTETVLNSFIRERNNGAEGHGLAGGYNSEADIKIIKMLHESVKDILPTLDKDGETLLIPKIGDVKQKSLKTLKLFDGNPICYRKLKKISAGKLLVDAQILRGTLSKSEVKYEVENILLSLPKQQSSGYFIFETTWDESWSPFSYIPDRLAAKHEFTGRNKELSELEEWINDTDSRKCMIYGDGGVGKTTLALEFIHRFLEGKINSKYRPTLITFYTAKKTRWGINGLEHISAQNVGVSDVALEIARMLTNETLDRSWFEKTPLEAIQKLGGLQNEMKISRDEHLIILDNTETMAKNDSDIQALAKQINELSRRVGRVILTSRRREQIEAFPIQTENWTEELGADF